MSPTSLGSRKKKNLRLVILILKSSSIVSDLNKAEFPRFIMMLLLPRDVQAQIRVSLVLVETEEVLW